VETVRGDNALNQMFLAGWKKCLWTKFIPFSIHYVLQNETLAAQIGSSEATLYQVQMGVMINWGENPFSATSNPSFTQEVNVCPFIYARTYERHQMVEMSTPLFSQDYIFVFRMPGHGSRLLLLSRPFNISVLSVTILLCFFFIVKSTTVSTKNSQFYIHRFG